MAEQFDSAATKRTVLRDETLAWFAISLLERKQDPRRFRISLDDSYGPLDGGMAGSVIDGPKEKLDPKSYDAYAKDLLQHPQFSRLEPQLAIDYVSQNFNKIHDKEHGSKMTVANLLSYKKDCIDNDPLKGALIDWMLHTQTNGDGKPIYDRFAKLSAIAGESDGISSGGLAIASDVVAKSLQRPESHSPVDGTMLSDVRFL
jgi:hypothetical protein